MTVSSTNRYPRTTSIKAGDLVICIDASPCTCGTCGGDPVPLRKGGIYRVEHVRIFQIGQFAGRPGIWLAGVKTAAGHLPGNNPARFRKVKRASAKFTAQMRALRPIQQDA